MLNNEELAALLLVLRQNGVSEFQNGFIQLKFNEASKFKNPMVDNESDVESKKGASNSSDWSDEDLFYSAKG